MLLATTQIGGLLALLTTKNWSSPRPACYDTDVYPHVIDHPFHLMSKKITPAVSNQRIMALCTEESHVEFAGPNLVTIENEKEQTGLYDVTTEQFIIPQKYDFITPLTDDLFQVHQGEAGGLYSLTAQKLVVPVKYEMILPTGDEQHLLFALYTAEEKVGLFDPTRNSIIAPAKFDAVQYLTTGWYIVSKGDQHGLFSGSDATQVQPAKYKNIILTEDGTHVIVEQKEKVGVFSLQERAMVVPTQFTHIYEHSDGILELEKKDKVGLYSLIEHKTLLENKYDQLVQLTDTLYEVATTKGVGLYCTKRQELIAPTEYEGITLLSNSLARVFRPDETEGFYNLKTKKEVA